MHTTRQPWRFPAVFDWEEYVQMEPTSRPLSAFDVRETTSEEREALYLALHAQTEALFKEPQGALRYPYIVPGGGYNQLWDWDGFFCGLAVCEEQPGFFRGCVLNFLDHISTKGRPPTSLHRRGPTTAGFRYRSWPNGRPSPAGSSTMLNGYDHGGID